MKYGISFLLLFFALHAGAQVNLLSLKQLDERVEKGKDTTYVVNFWATWCGPCVEELPSFEQLHAENLSKPVKVILVSLDFKSKLQSAVVPFVKKHQLKSEVYVINEPDQQVFIEKVDPKWSGSLPATLFLNKDRKIRFFYEKPFVNYSELKAMFENLKTP